MACLSFGLGIVGQWATVHQQQERRHHFKSGDHWRYSRQFFDCNKAPLPCAASIRRFVGRFQDPIKRILRPHLGGKNLGGRRPTRPKCASEWIHFVSGIRQAVYVEPESGLETTRLEWFDFHLDVSKDRDAVVAALSS